jgi:hypothetical protein
VAPSVTNSKDFIALDIQHTEIVKMIVHFSKQLQIIFLYTKPSCAKFIVDQLTMTQVNDQCELLLLNHQIIINDMSFTAPYFAPLSQNETHKKIVLLVDNVTDENKQIIKSIYKSSQYEEIVNRDANQLLVRSNGIPVNAGSNNNSNNNSSMNNQAIVGDGM